MPAGLVEIPLIQHENGLSIWHENPGRDIHTNVMELLASRSLSSNVHESHSGLLHVMFRKSTEPESEFFFRALFPLCE